MKQLLFWIAGLCLWLSVFYNLERWNEPINISTFVYVYTLIIVIAVLLIRWLQQAPIYWLFLMTLPPYFLLKYAYGYEIGGSALPITVTEIGAIGITILLARQIGNRVSELQDALLELTLGKLRNGGRFFDVYQTQIYQEIRRARRYHRTAAIIAVSATEESVKLSLNRFIKDAQREIAKKYVNARMADLMVKELDDFDIVAERDNYFIVLLPELSRKSLPEIINNLKGAFNKNLGLDTRIGVSIFPDEAVTLESLIDKAVSAMDQAPQNADQGLPETNRSDGRGAITLDRLDPDPGKTHHP